MAHQQELEIEIDSTGKVQVHVKGMPGKSCLEFVEVFRSLLGPTSEETPTLEFYEAEIVSQTRIRQNRQI